MKKTGFEKRTEQRETIKLFNKLGKRYNENKSIGLINAEMRNIGRCKLFTDNKTTETVLLRIPKQREII